MMGSLMKFPRFTPGTVFSNVLDGKADWFDGEASITLASDLRSDRVSPSN